MSFSLGAGDVVSGKYRVERVIGVGGMGVVVAARHLELGEPVALKFLVPAAAADPDALARFLQEGRAAARIRSEHVVRVLDVGRLDDGAPYIVMELLRGEGLEEVLRKSGSLPIPRSVDYLLEACEALAEAHALGIVHRDLKPSNLFVAARPDGSTCVKLLDFGVSKLADRDGSHPILGMTTTASMLGSPRYMAPEQMASARDVDTRADIWSLGVILYELVTGARPFPAANVPELCKKVLEGSPVPIRSHTSDVPEDLERTIGRCLERDRARRIGSVMELADALSPHASDAGRLSVARIRGVADAAASGALDLPEPVLAPASSGDAATAPLSRKPFDVTPPSASPDVTQSAAESAALQLEPLRSKGRSPILWAALGLVAALTVALAVIRSGAVGSSPAASGAESAPVAAQAAPGTASAVASVAPPAPPPVIEPAVDRAPEPAPSAPAAQPRHGRRPAPSTAPSTAPSGKLFGSRDW